MKIGVCAPGRYAGIIKEKGFDYIELPVTSFSYLDDVEFERFVQDLEHSGLPCYACNFFFPDALKVVGPNVDRAKVEDYCRVAVRRIHRLGIRSVTIGSGGARCCPEDFALERAVEQFGEWLLFVAGLLSDSECFIGIESIGRHSTNILNTFSECLALAKDLGHPKVRIMADFQQIRSQEEALEDILYAQGMLVHAHVSNSGNLHCPGTRDEDEYDRFFDVLRRIGYKGNLTVETKFYDATLAPDLLRSLAAIYRLDV